MSKIDSAKEDIAYLKFWLGIVVVTGLIGWVVTSSDRASGVIRALAIVTTVALSCCVLRIHGRIRAAYQKDRKAMSGETLGGILLILLAMLFIWIVHDIGRNR